MTFVPMLPWPVLVVLTVAALAAVWWNPSTVSVPGESRATHWRLTAAVLLLSLAAHRPGVPGDEAEATATNLNVYFVVDTTSSIIAQDWGNDRPRLAGVRGDITDLALALPGARYSIITFDHAARVRLPLSTDTTALEAAISTLLPEPSEYSHGSSVTEANERLGALLRQAAERHQERGRIVFYLGDGEHTAEGEPPPFTIEPGLVNGGAVLGYGTNEGGRMKSTRSRYDTSSTFIKDPSTGEDALSVIDEQRLRNIASQLGLAYLHRDARESVLPAIASVDLVRFGTTDETERERIRTRHELYWPLLVGVAGIAAWELGLAVAGLLQTRRRKEAAT